MITEIELNAVHVMVDLETMSTEPNAAIISIGAVACRQGVILREFYSVVSLQSCMDVGLDVSASTIMWWLGQSEEARKAVRLASNTITKELGELNAWAESLNNPRVWGNGSDFDNVILKNAYKAVGLKPFWSYYNDRCYRTIKNLIDPQRRLLPREAAVAHHALFDAADQMAHLQAMFEFIEDKSLLRKEEDDGK